jgi:hypothetical protein
VGRDRRRDIERACADYPATQRHLGERYCPALLVMGDINVSARYAFRADRMTHVDLFFAPRDFDRLAAIFLERYGPATATLQVGDRLEWSGERAVVSIARYLDANRATGHAEITTKTEIQESKRLFDEQTKGAAKGL